MEKHDKIFVDVNQHKLEVLSAVLSFFIFSIGYWCAFSLISPQDTIFSILGLFVFILFVVPGTFIIKSRTIDFLKK